MTMVMSPLALSFGMTRPLCNMKLGYFGEAKKKLIRFAGEETTPKPKDDEVVVYKSFFRARLRFPLNEMFGEVLNNFEIFLHQLTPNAIVRLSIFI